MPWTEPFNVLFLCTADSARSILAEAILNREGRGQFPWLLRRQPAERAGASVHLRSAAQTGFRRERASLEELDRFGEPNAAPLDFVFTVCDNAAGEACLGPASR